MMTANDYSAWEAAKRMVDNMKDPGGTQNFYLPEINGFECSVNFYQDKSGKQVILWNNKYRTSYSKVFTPTQSSSSVLSK